MIMPEIQKQRIIEYIKEKKRFDGRKPDEHRKIEVKLGISNKADGSCSVKFGDTEVYAGIKMDAMEPYPDSPDEGTMVTSAELSPIASPDFESGPPRIDAIELARIIDRGIRESGFIDFKKLCIKEGEKVWQVNLDVYAVNDNGNLIDAASLAALIALANAKMPEYDEENEKVKFGEMTDNPIPLNKDAMAFNITFHKIGNEIIVDPNKEEEEISEWRLSVAVADNKGEPRISAMQKGKESAVSEEEMEKILNLVEDKYKKMIPKIKKMVWGK